MYLLIFCFLVIFPSQMTVFKKYKILIAYKTKNSIYMLANLKNSKQIVCISRQKIR